MLLEELKPGLRIDGLIPAQVITVVFAQWHGTDALELTYKTNEGVLGQQVIFRKDQDSLSVAQTGSRAFDANASDFKLVAEAQRITLAGLFDPMLAVATSDVRPLPHQIRAVYGELLPRTPLRFLLADDPGAGKTIMAGLYIKELLLRADVRRGRANGQQGEGNGQRLHDVRSFARGRGGAVVSTDVCQVIVAARASFSEVRITLRGALAPDPVTMEKFTGATMRARDPTFARNSPNWW